MDWLTIAIIGILFVILLIVLCEKHQMQKETELFANQVEEVFDAILSGRKWKVEEELEDSLWGRTGTQLAKAEAVFLRKEEESLREKEVVKSLISDMSHQTRTPIANMKLYMELLEEEALSENRSFFLTKMKEQIEKIDFLMQNMVKMSRLETGILQIHQENKRIYETIRRVIASLVPQAALKQIDLYVDCDETICFFHDSKWTEEAIYNILDNALKYTESGGSIHIEVQKQELFYKISVSDTGKGIAPERQAEIFTRFYREPEVHDQPGVGIGLYLARKIIELQNGYIEVQSEIGNGSCFCLYFPVKNE